MQCHLLSQSPGEEIVDGFVIFLASRCKWFPEETSEKGLRKRVLSPDNAPERRRKTMESTLGVDEAILWGRVASGNWDNLFLQANCWYLEQQKKQLVKTKQKIHSVL